MFAITLDIDWAPDFIIDSVSELLLSHGVKSTWFVTHDSAATRLLAQNNALIERGIHPNFLAGGTHGNTYEEALNYVLNLVPGAACVRTHALHQSNPLLKLMCVDYGLKIDSSLFLPGYQEIRPIEFEFAQHGKFLTRIPYIWGDQYEITRTRSNLNFAGRFGFGGIKVFNFHPVHIYFNAYNEAPYKQLKALSPDITRASKASCEQLINRSARGVRDFLLDLLAEIKKSGNGLTLSEIPSLYTRQHDRKRNQ